MGHKEVVLASSQGSEVVLVSLDMDQRSVQGIGSRQDGVWGSPDVPFSGDERYKLPLPI